MIKSLFCLLTLMVLPLFAAPSELEGQEVPNFSLTDQDGKTHQLSDLKDQIVVLEWTNPTCPFVVAHYKLGTMKKLAAEFEGKIVWMAINSGKSTSMEINKKWASEQGIGYPILNDADGKVGKAFGAKTTPHMMVIAKGKLVYSGAIDDDSNCKGGTTNYVAQTLGAVLAGKPVALAKTKPYGCSVKY